MASMAYLSTMPSPNPSGPGGFSPNPGGYGPPSLERAPPSTSSLANNIVNQKADTSLYQNCIRLRRKLATVPGFEHYLREMDQEELETGEDTDPVTSMWNMLRQGFPLLDIYNAGRPVKQLAVDRVKTPESKWPKAAAFQFLTSCIHQLGIPAGECFLISDLYGTDTTGFVKVLKVVDRVLEIFYERGTLSMNSDPVNLSVPIEPQRKSHSEMIVQELVTTERDYVQHLETLQAFKDQLDQNGSLAGDVIHDMFLNLSALLDFQQRFLIRIEQQNALEPAMQNWGALFVQYQEGFRVYEPFIGNQHQCNESVTRNWNTIENAQYGEDVQGMVGSVTVLTGFLLKPFQRLSKYPLLLDELRKRSNYDKTREDDLATGAAAMKAVLDRANALLHKADLAKEVTELVALVDDWKGHKLEHFGDLVMNGTWPVLKGEGSKDTQREVMNKNFIMRNFLSLDDDYGEIYLFERILLCCKEINPNKAKNRLAGRSAVDKRGKLKLQLKGRIFLQNVTDVVRLTPAPNAPQAAYTLQIWWKGDPGIESFTIRFPTAEYQQKWFDALQKLKTENPSLSRVPSTLNGTSENQFTSLSGLTLENPYEGQEDDYEDEPHRKSAAATFVERQSMFSSRTASANSHRARSTTGSGPYPPPMMGRVAPPRFPMAEPGVANYISNPQLKLTTDMQNNGEVAASAFSPGGDSPNSSRQSSQLSGYFPRHHGHSSSQSQNSWQPDPNKHNTAPPMGRAPLREDENATTYSTNGRVAVQRPSLPAMVSHNAQQMPGQNRSRSISSPDVHQQNGYPTGRRTPNGYMQTGPDEVPVPPIPPHMTSMRNPINRSQSSSPTEALRNARGMAPPPTGLRNGGAPNHNSYAYDQRQNSMAAAPPGTIAGAGGRVLSPPVSASALPSQPEPIPFASQLKVKVHYEPDPDTNYVTIVVPVVIKYRSLIDRIDSKMERNKKSSISKGTARLRYRDANGDLVRIDCDDDVQMAIEDWSETNGEKLRRNHMPDFDLYWRDV